MRGRDLETRHHRTFESIKRTDAVSDEYWLARELAPILEYRDYRNFRLVVEKAKTACAQAGAAVSDHFGDITEMVSIGSGARREVPDIRLSRYACYEPAHPGHEHRAARAPSGESVEGPLG